LAICSVAVGNESNYASRGICLVVAAVFHVMHRVDEFATHQVQRRFVVKLNIVEWVGKNLGHPCKAGLHIAKKEKMDGAKEQPTGGNHEPDKSHVVQEFRWRLVRFEDTEECRIEKKHQG
jgi:hypothetical protein